MKNLFATAVAVASLAEFGAASTSSDIGDATNASKAMSGVTNMLDINVPSNNAAGFFNPLNELKLAVPEIAIIGKVFKIARPSDTAKILAALQVVSNQIAGLQDSMSEQFAQTLSDISYQACKSSYAKYEVVIRNSYTDYMNYVDSIGGSHESLYEFNFTDGCKGGQCNNATQAIIDGLTGSGGLLGCDIMERIFDGNPGKAGGYYQGYRDDMINKNSYLYSLATMGTVVQSAYLTITTGDVDAYQLVNNKW